MIPQPLPPQPLPPQARAMEIVQTAVAGKLIATLTEAGLPDVLAKGPRSIAELAAETGLDADALARGLRAAALLGAFAAGEDGRWRNTDIGDALRTGSPGSVRDYVVYALHDGNWRAWQHLGESFRSGAPCFADANGGLGFWQYLDAHQEIGDAFHRGMAAMASVTVRALPAALALERFATIADIGGGTGTVLAELLKAAPHLQGVLYDQAEAVAVARDRFETAGLGNRVRIEAGDLFESVPPDLDAYVLKNVLHDHDADRCARLLDVLHAAMPSDARLFVIEAVLPDRPVPHPAIWRDLHMMVALGGRERTEAEWRVLLGDHGFVIEDIRPLPGPDAAIEVRIA